MYCITLAVRKGLDRVYNGENAFSRVHFSFLHAKLTIVRQEEETKEGIGVVTEMCTHVFPVFPRRNRTKLRCQRRERSCEFARNRVPALAGVLSITFQYPKRRKEERRFTVIPRIRDCRVTAASSIPASRRAHRS